MTGGGGILWRPPAQLVFECATILQNKQYVYIEKTKYTHKILSLRFNGLFPGGPGLAGTRMSPFWILLELRVMEVVVTTGARRRAKLQSNRHHQQTNTRLFTGRMPFLSPNQQCQRTEGTPLGHTENITT